MTDEKPRRKAYPKPPREPLPIGRPPLPGPPRRDRKLYLPDGAMERLREIGRGSASEGVMYLLAQHARKERAA